ncbi:MAG: dihydropteroate synthase [Gammaproteobacteria bacterium]|nr:dihydropteroate synthase [Gammaproteobacteria bacterium]
MSLNISPPRVMGILNVTPDSFSDGGQFNVLELALQQATSMIDAGVDIIDIGGESTRPGAAPVPLQQELDRVIPVIEAIQQRFSITISVDSSKAVVMQAAVTAGAGMINDVCALQGEGALNAAVELRVPVCLMHMQGVPGSMQQQPEYTNVVTEVKDFLLTRAKTCEQAGIARKNIILDPGFGFGKTLEHNLALLRQLDCLVAAGYPVLVGLSRKSMIAEVLDLPVDQRLQPSVALAVIAAWQGVQIIRVHDVAETVQALRMCAAVFGAHCAPYR